MKQPTSYSLTPEARQMLGVLAAANGASLSFTVETLIRQAHKRLIGDTATPTAVPTDTHSTPQRIYKPVPKPK